MSIETLKNAGQILMMTAEDLQSVFSSMMATFWSNKKRTRANRRKKKICFRLRRYGKFSTYKSAPCAIGQSAVT